MILRRVMAAVVCLVLIGYDVSGEGKKSSYPGPASWDVQRLEGLFRVVKVDSDGKTRLKWTLQLKETVRTADFVRALDRENRLTVLFLGEGDVELARVELKGADYKGFSRDRLTKAGTTVELTLELPEALAKSQKVVVRRGRVE